MVPARSKEGKLVNVVTWLTDGASDMDFTCTAQRLKSHGLHVEHTWGTCELQETKRSWAAQQGEEAALRAALRAADAKCPAPVKLAAAQAEMASLRLVLLLYTHTHTHTHSQTLCSVSGGNYACYCILLDACIQTICSKHSWANAAQSLQIHNT